MPTADSSLAAPPELKAELTVRLSAGGVVVAESDDPDLWQDVLALITGRRAPTTTGPRAAPREPASTERRPTPSDERSAVLGLLSPLQRFAADLGIDEDQARGACAPDEDAPFLHLDPERLAAFQADRPRRGPTAVSAITLALTLLILWREARGEPAAATLAEGQAILAELGRKDPNARRAVRACSFLALDGDRASVALGRTLGALALAKSYCTAAP